MYMPQSRSSQPFLANHLLSGLPGETRSQLLPLLTPMTFIRGQILLETGIVNDHAFFITRGLVSYFDGAGACTGATVGPEGLVGYSCLLSEQHVAFHQAIAQLGGSALRVSASALRQLVVQLPPLRDRLMRYIEAMMAQNAQLAACNAQHDLLARCTRWLLMAHDRASGEDLPFTHEYLSIILAAHRPAVTAALCALEREGLLDRRRGHIGVRNPAGLERVSCGCYRRIAHEYSRLLGNPFQDSTAAAAD